MITRKKIYDNALFIGAVGVVVGFSIAIAQATMNLVGFENGRPTGSVIKELRAEVRSNKFFSDSLHRIDFLRDSIIITNVNSLKYSTETNTAILCTLVEDVGHKRLSICDDVLRVRGLR